MNTDRGRKPLLIGRSVLLVDDWCAATGLDLSVAATLLCTGVAEGVFRGVDREPFGFYEDALPTRHQLEAMRLTVRSDYDPDEIRSHSAAEEGDEDDDPHHDADAPDGDFATWSFTIRSDPA